tara:strand:+ start:280 stop:474 length:195 start_codon:yes stop_codon:yes gene_type:complete
VKLYPLTKLSGEKVAVSDVVEKEGYLFLKSPDEKVDVPLYAMKCNTEFIRFFNERLRGENIWDG